MARILLADDDAATRDLARRGLEGDGHVVVTVNDGDEALSRLRGGESFDLLLADVDMPGTDGISLAGIALGLPAAPRILLMSGLADALQHAAAAAGGRIATLAKPFTLDQLRSAARSALES